MKISEMKRPRIKCARCGKMRVPPRGVYNISWLVGSIYLEVKWRTPNRPICEQCSDEIGKLMFAGLREKL